MPRFTTVRREQTLTLIHRSTAHDPQRPLNLELRLITQIARAVYVRLFGARVYLDHPRRTDPICGYSENAHRQHMGHGRAMLVIWFPGFESALLPRSAGLSRGYKIAGCRIAGAL